MCEVKVAEGAITPGDLVKLGTADYQVVVNTATTLKPYAVADLNYDAEAEGLDPLTHDFAAGDKCVVIRKGICRVIADAAGMTAGSRGIVGTTTAYMVGDYTDTAANAGDTYVTTNLELIKVEIITTVGSILTDAATTVAGLVDIDL